MPRLYEGVLNSRQMLELEAAGIITRAGGGIKAEESAMDLHLGTEGWELKGSIKQIAVLDDQGRLVRETVADICNTHGKAFALDKAGVRLEKSKTYVVKLQESVAFSKYPGLSGEATGKSSVGRLDVLTRLLADGSPEYERVPPGYHGPLYVEIIPISFPVVIKPGVSLNQLRIHCGGMKPMATTVGRRLLFDSDDGSQFSVLAQERKTLSVYLKGVDDREVVAYRLLADKDLPPIDLSNKKSADPKQYFEPLRAEEGTLIIEVDRFYILRSVERLRLPEDIAVTGMAYTENFGELRIHYAGFAHPWFGTGRTDNRVGTPLIFEVRAHNFPILLRHREVLATIHFYAMSEAIPTSERTQKDYSAQELQLSSYFTSGQVSG